MLICCQLDLFPPELKEMRLIRNSQFHVTFWNPEVIGKDENNHDVTSGIGKNEESACAVWLNFPSTVKDMTGTSWESLQCHTCTWFFTSPNCQNNANHLFLIITSIKDCFIPILFSLLSHLSMTHMLCLLLSFSLISPSKYCYCGVYYIIAFYWPSLSSASLCIVPDWNKALSQQSHLYCLVHRLIFRKIYTALFFIHFISHLDVYSLFCVLNFSDITWPFIYCWLSFFCACVCCYFSQVTGRNPR